MGSLPAIGGLVVLVLVFLAVQPVFRGLYNFGNMFTEGSATIFIAMGLVFVLLLGEIDLAAGFTAGVAASVMARLMEGYDEGWWVTIPAAIVTGVVIGLITGLLVAKVRIPSFVVTLAFFLAFQGVTLFILNNGKGPTGSITLHDKVVNGFANSQMPKWIGWLLAVHRHRGVRAARSCWPGGSVTGRVWPASRGRCSRPRSGRWPSSRWSWSMR